MIGNLVNSMFDKYTLKKRDITLTQNSKYLGLIFLLALFILKCT